MEQLRDLKDVAPAFGALIGLLSAIVALTVFAYTRRANRSRATLDMVLKTSLDDAGRGRYSDFKALMARHADPNDPIDILDFADPAVTGNTDKKILLTQINEYELIALGIRMGIFDEGIYKLWFQGQFMRDYESVAGYLGQVHQKRPSVFCEVAWLYTRWKRKPHPKSKPNMFARMYWAATGNTVSLQHYLDTQAQ